MSNELIVIEKTNAVAVLSTDDGISALLNNVRDNINEMDGGSMKNKTSRAKIRSNAFKATKAYKKINDETITPLINSLVAKIQPQLDVIDAIKENQSVLKSGLQDIRKEVNAEVDAFEAELKRVEDEKLFYAAWDEALIDNDKFNEQLEMKKQMDHMQAIIDNNQFDEDKRKQEEEAKSLAIKLENERIEREKRIAAQAALDAKLEAERIANENAKRLEREKQDAIEKAAQAKRDAEAQKQAAIKAEIEVKEAEKLRIKQREEFELKVAQDKAIAEENARKQAAQAAEDARVAEINRQQEENRKAQEQNKKRLADQEYMRKKCTAAKESLIKELGISQELAIEIVKKIRSGKIDEVTLNI